MPFMLFTYFFMFPHFLALAQGYKSWSILTFALLRMLVYEYVNNGNLDQWLHGAMRNHGTLAWEACIKLILLQRCKFFNNLTNLIY